MALRHVPVMVGEVLEILDCRPGHTVVDGTLGGAGHAGAICRRIRPGGRLIGIDQDAAAVDHARQVLTDGSVDIRILRDNFVNLPEILSRIGIEAVDGIVLDLGLSLDQLISEGRGFSFQADEPLDMRMDQRDEITAERLVNAMSCEELRRIFRDYGEERHAASIAEAIVRLRRAEPIRTTGRLAGIVCGVVRRRQSGPRRIHPATRVFQALRIAVNRELERLAAFMETAPHRLNPGGRLCVISFHSLEDRIVKQGIRSLASPCVCPPQSPVCTCGRQPLLRLLNRKVIRPTAEEVARNPAARSARLRAAERIGPWTGAPEVR